MCIIWLVGIRSVWITIKLEECEIVLNFQLCKDYITHDLMERMQAFQKKKS